MRPRPPESKRKPVPGQSLEMRPAASPGSSPRTDRWKTRKPRFRPWPRCIGAHTISRNRVATGHRADGRRPCTTSRFDTVGNNKLHPRAGSAAGLMQHRSRVRQSNASVTNSGVCPSGKKNHTGARVIATTMTASGITDRTGFILSPVGRRAAPFFTADKSRRDAGLKKAGRFDCCE